MVNFLTVLDDSLSFIIRETLLKILRYNLVENFKSRHEYSQFWKRMGVEDRARGPSLSEGWESQGPADSRHSGVFDMDGGLDLDDYTPAARPVPCRGTREKRK